ncbi:hypothetical protein [Nonomuraea sp. NPDC049480]|uniref:hypothetical protein n=1 Tax=Nonomuraea sp. NPDC049480 TaxID=3364353 RepID=UPI0037B1D997
MERQRRWDIDERYTGVSDAAAMLPAVHQLEEAMRGEGWVTEEPDAHLLPALRRVPGCECVTGVMPGDPPGVYKSHGHLIRVIVTE